MKSQPKATVATAAPINCAKMKAGVSAGRIPANVLVNALAAVTAGFANEVDAVNQYAAAMYDPTAKGTAEALVREQLQITASKPNVATNSLKT